MIEEMIKKYFSGNCSEEEKHEIYLYFRRNPSLFLDHFSEEDFIATEQSQKGEALDVAKAHKLILGFKRKRRYRKVIFAASILFFIGVSVIAFQKNKGTDITDGMQAVDNQMGVKENSVAKIIINTSSIIESFTLPDSSKIELFPQSKISYLAQYAPGRRNVLLEGTAIFNVAHDQTKPFTVYCGGTATTALGTAFKISTARNHKVTVQLLQGKIRVSATKKSNISSDTYYLLPGSSISYNNRSMVFSKVDDHLEKNAEPSYNGNRVTNMAAKKVENHQRLQLFSNAAHFDGTSLQTVLDYLAELHHVKISYPTKIVGHIKFIGTLKKDEPLNSILNNIAIMNNLSFSMDTLKGIYILRQQKE